MKAHTEDATSHINYVRSHIEVETAPIVPITGHIEVSMSHIALAQPISVISHTVPATIPI